MAHWLALCVTLAEDSSSSLSTYIRWLPSSDSSCRGSSTALASSGTCADTSMHVIKEKGG